MNKVVKNKQITVFAGCLIKDGKVLMNLRKESELPEAHLKWEFPGGKVDFGETPQEALKREFLEETGITINIRELLPFIQVSYWDYKWGRQQTLCFCFLCEYIQETPIKKKDHHVEKIAWINVHEVKRLNSLPGTNEIIELASKALKLP